jgi:chromosome segregation ATPase
VSTLEQHWRKAAASINKVFSQQAGPQRRLEELEREILAVIAENQGLASELERIRADSERRRSEELRKIETLEQTQRQTETARIADAKRLVEFEQLFAGLDTDRKLQRDQIKALEASLAETTSRLEIRDNQLKFLQDSARDQLQALKTALAEATSRLETGDNELKRLQDSAHKQILAIETSLAETSSRFESTDNKIQGLRAKILEQAQQLEASFASTTRQFDATNNQVKALEKKLELEHRLQQNIFEDAQAQLREQDARLKRAMMTWGFILALVVVAVASLFLGVR